LHFPAAPDTAAAPVTAAPAAAKPVIRVIFIIAAIAVRCVILISNSVEIDDGRRRAAGGPMD